MKRSALSFLVVGFLACAAAWQADSAGAQAAKKDAHFVSADKATYTEPIPGASRAVLWGDPDKAAHGVFTKFKPGFDAGMHTHTNELRLVVIRGAYLYKPEGGAEIRVGPGAYLAIPGGLKHWSGGDAKEGALFYQEGLGKFDLNPVK
jgi:quercetin dioxygenase-like cupin family protein